MDTFYVNGLEPTGATIITLKTFHMHMFINLNLIFSFCFLQHRTFSSSTAVDQKDIQEIILIVKQALQLNQPLRSFLIVRKIMSYL